MKGSEEHMLEKKNQEIGELIDNCIKSANEIALLLAIGLASLAPSKIREIIGVEISLEKRAVLREECNKLGGLDEVLKKNKQTIEENSKYLSELAEFLEERGFIIKNFKDQLSEDQFSWLTSHIGEIKKYLKGIEII